MSTTGITGQVLGATATIAGAIYVLPNTGVFQYAFILPCIAIIIGSTVLFSLIITRLIRLFS